MKWAMNVCELFQGSQEIPSKQIGYVLRILGQNPTEDDIVEMVMKVHFCCDVDVWLCDQID